MLESIRAHSQSWIAKVILVLITVPFALFGVDSYLKNAGSGAEVAKVNGEPITVQDFGKALQDARSNLKDKTDPALFDQPEFRSALLDKLINQHLLRAEIKRGGYVVNDEQLSKLIVNLPEFQKNGQFSQEVYDQALATNKFTPSRFEEMMRHDLLLQQVRDGITSTAFTSKMAQDNALQARSQQREVSVATLHSVDFLTQAKVVTGEIKAYYDKHQDEFRVPEQVRIEYVAFSNNNLIATMTVSDEEAKAFYQQNTAKFQGDEERHASHILITFGGKTDAVAKAAAKEKALKVLAEVKKSPQQFDVLAKKYSQDPGSAENGGDLGAVKRGVMVKPFEEAVFSMAPGSISDLVETEFGYHIIKLTEVKGATPSFEEARSQIRAELMFQKSQTKFAEESEKFSNTVYEQSSSLKPAADAHHLQIQQSGWMSRQDVAKFFKDNEKIASAVFSDEVKKDKRNTEAVEVAPNILVAARMIESRPSSMKPLSEVQSAIESTLQLLQASKLAHEQGEKSVASLNQGHEGGTLEWTSPVKIDRSNLQGLSEYTMIKAFQADASKLPAYVGAASKDGGYVLIRVTKVEDGLQQLDAAAKETRATEYQAALREEYLQAYLKTLRAGAKVKINQELLKRKDSAS
ncbi:MAG: SurA N-terminal domain-containing protein [Methylophilaceae bacterium]